MSEDLKEMEAGPTIQWLLGFKGSFVIKIQDGKIIRVTGDFGIPPDISKAICNKCKSKSDKTYCHTGIKMTEFKSSCGYFRGEDVLK